MKTASRFHSLKFTLTFVVAMLILFSVFLSSTLSYSRYVKNFQQQSSGQIEQTLEQLSINLSTYLDELFRLTVYLYYDNDVVSAMEENGGTNIDYLRRQRVIENYLNKIMIMPRKDILNIFVITDAIYYGGRFPKSIGHNTDYESYSWYKEAMLKQSPIFVPPHQEQLVTFPDNTVFSIVKQLRSVQNIDEIIGVIKVDASYSGIADIAEKVESGKDGVLCIVDNNQNMIYRSASLKQTDALLDISLRENDSWIETIDSTEYMITTQHIKSADWTIVAFNSLEEMTQGAQETRRFTLLLATLSSLSAIFVLLIFTHRFLQPLMNIVQLMKEVRKGNFHVVFSGKRNDEISYLGNSFNEMVKTINFNIERNTELATKVYESEILHTEAKFQALQSQIKPHFLYNTLNMISIQIQVGRSEQAVDNIGKLHLLLRGMAKWGKEILVENEFSILDAYLGIQSSRFEDRISYELHLAEGLAKQHILSFILQPIVENAVIHGCEPKREKTRIIVSGYTKDSYTYFTVEDTGKGMTEEQIIALERKLTNFMENKEENLFPGTDGHIGLENVNRRIKIRYGNQYGVSFTSRFGVGTTFTIKLPIPEEEDKKHVPSISS